MRYIVECYSEERDIENIYNVQVDALLWREIIQEEIGSRVFCRISHPSGLADIIAPMGGPVIGGVNTGRKGIYLSYKMLEDNLLMGVGEEVRIEFLPNDAFPNATKLTFQVLDSVFYETDMKAELETILNAIGVIRKDDIITIPLKNMGGLEVKVRVVATEPADIVLCDGEEVEVEFQEEEKPVANIYKGLSTDVATGIDFGPMVPSASVKEGGKVQGKGYTLRNS